MSSTPDPDGVAVCAVNPFAGGFRFQSSQPHLKRLIMFDHSNGKGRVFFHPAVEQELFGSAHICDIGKGHLPDNELKAEYSASSLTTYKQMVEGAFTSLQSLRASRCNGTLLQKGSATLQGLDISSQMPWVSESIAEVHGENKIRGIQFTNQPRVASQTLVCEEKPEVSAILPLAESPFDCNQYEMAGAFCKFSRSQVSGPKVSEATSVTSELMQENTEDLDALLSSDDEEEDDDDDDVRSTGHSPDESLGKEYSCGEDDGDAVEQHPCKKRRMCDSARDEEPSTNVVGVLKDSDFPIDLKSQHSSRRQKIKRTVKALRTMIPGGALLDTAFVLDKTITYVKDLRDRVNQLEVIRLQSRV